MLRSPLIELFHQPQAVRLILAGVLGRLPTGMVGFALVLFVHERTRSFAAAGAVTATFGISAAVVSPLQGRLVDRFGQSRLLFPTAFLDATLLSAIVIAGYGAAALGTLVALAALAGLARPPLSACARSVWPTVLPRGPLLESVYALEGVLVEVIFILGPLLVAGLALVAGPGASLLAAAGLSLFGTLWFATSAPSRSWRGERNSDARWTGPLAASGMRTLLAGWLAMGLAFGMLEVGMPAFAATHGEPAAAGVIFAAMAAGAMAGGLWYGAREWKISVTRRYVLFLSLFSVGFMPLSVAGSVSVMVLLMAVAGLALAPTVAAGYALIGDAAPRGTLTEAYSWTATANVGGTALGAALAGFLVEQINYRFAVVAAGLLVGAGAVTVFLRRNSLESERQPMVE